MKINSTISFSVREIKDEVVDRIHKLDSVYGDGINMWYSYLERINKIISTLKYDEDISINVSINDDTFNRDDALLIACNILFILKEDKGNDTVETEYTEKDNDSVKINIEYEEPISTGYYTRPIHS